jgi:hypothetical protein
MLKVTRQIIKSLVVDVIHVVLIIVILNHQSHPLKEKVVSFAIGVRGYLGHDPRLLEKEANSHHLIDSSN